MDKKYIEDLKEIKDIMNRSTRFISLSGLSGVSTGITALAGVYLAYQTIFKEQDYLTYNAVELSSENVINLLLIAVATLILSIGAAIFFTTKKLKKKNHSVWDQQTKRLLINLSIPLITGGLLCLMLLLKGFVGLLPPITLIFYGLALVNASKYTLPEIRSLGLIEIFLGLIAIQFIEYGLLFWAFGFGAIQIVYGLFIQRKYKL
jgi:hypothetical protein